MKITKLDGSYLKLLQRIQNNELLIIDDFGLHPFDNYTRQALMDVIEVIEAKYNKSSIIIRISSELKKSYGILKCEFSN